MNTTLSVLMLTSVSIGFLHTLFGPDHYVPFIVMSKARKWSHAKTALITILCGIGHVGSSVVIGLAGVALGIAVGKLEAVESYRGDLAAWALIAFGLVYGIWGIRRALKGKPHTHLHIHSDGTVHSHEHIHSEDHAHVHEEDGKVNITPWILFTIFVLGPCEPLIPILMYPAAKHSTIGVVAVTLVFGAVTVATMLGMVMIVGLGIDVLPLKKLEKYSHAMAGFVIALCGAGIAFLGL